MQRVQFCSTRSVRRLKLLRRTTLVCGTLMKKMDRYFIWFFCFLFFVLFCFFCFFNPFTPGNEPKEISYDSVIAFPYRQMTRSKNIYIEDGLKCKTANSYLKFPKYVSHEVPRNLIEKILNIALICESKPVTGNL